MNPIGNQAFIGSDSIDHVPGTRDRKVTLTDAESERIVNHE